MRAGAPVGPVALINRPVHPAGSGCDLRRHEARLNCAREATLGNRGTAKTRTQGQNQRDIAVAGCRGVAQGGRACTGGAREGAAGGCGPGGRCGCHARRRGRRLCGPGRLARMRTLRTTTRTQGAGVGARCARPARRGRGRKRAAGVLLRHLQDSGWRAAAAWLRNFGTTP